MSESDPRFHTKKSIDESGTAIIVSEKSAIVYEKEEEQSNWVGGNTPEDKIGRALELSEKGEQFILPKDMTLDDIKKWVPKAAKTLNKNKVLERKEGRTGLEVWAFPSNYANLEGSMGGGGGRESLEDVGSRTINIGELIYDEISIHGRETIDELCRNIEAIDPQLITVVVNTMIQDKFLQLFTEEDGLITLELVEAVKRNRSLGIIPEEELPSLEDKESERHVGGTQRVEDNVPVIDPEMVNVDIIEGHPFPIKPYNIWPEEDLSEDQSPILE